MTDVIPKLYRTLSPQHWFWAERELVKNNLDRVIAGDYGNWIYEIVRLNEIDVLYQTYHNGKLIVSYKVELKDDMEWKD